jgi:hypothetical protein
MSSTKNSSPFPSFSFPGRVAMFHGWSLVISLISNIWRTVVSAMMHVMTEILFYSVPIIITIIINLLYLIFCSKAKLVILMLGIVFLSMYKDCSKRRILHVPNAFKTIDNHLKCLCFECIRRM